MPYRESQLAVPRIAARGEVLIFRASSSATPGIRTTNAGAFSTCKPTTAGHARRRHGSSRPTPATAGGPSRSGASVLAGATSSSRPGPQSRWLQRHTRGVRRGRRSRRGGGRCCARRAGRRCRPCRGRSALLRPRRGEFIVPGPRRRSGPRRWRSGCNWTYRLAGDPAGRPCSRWTTPVACWMLVDGRPHDLELVAAVGADARDRLHRQLDRVLLSVELIGIGVALVVDDDVALWIDELGEHCRALSAGLFRGFSRGGVGHSQRLARRRCPCPAGHVWGDSARSSPPGGPAWRRQVLEVGSTPGKSGTVRASLLWAVRLLERIGARCVGCCLVA